jgi:integrase
VEPLVEGLAMKWDYKTVVLTGGFMGRHKEELRRDLLEQQFDQLGVGVQKRRLRSRRTRRVPLVMEEIAATCPPDDRTPERRVFQGFSPDVAKNVMARACKAAGIPHYHPHDFRHRYASVKLREGVPVTELAAQLGHARKSMTLDTYSHVLLDS